MTTYASNVREAALEYLEWQRRSDRMPINDLLEIAGLWAVSAPDVDAEVRRLRRLTRKER